jgi:hypothetical protein
MNFKLSLAVVVVIVIIVVAAALYFGTSIQAAGSTLPISVATRSGMDVEVVSANLTVGFQSGLWQISLKNTGTVSVMKIKVYLTTPIDSFVCSGPDQSAGLSFSNCTVAPSGNPLPPGTTISGSASGIGEGSGKVGSQYGVAAKVLFSNGDTVWVNSTVTATNPS